MKQYLISYNIYTNVNGERLKSDVVYKLVTGYNYLDAQRNLIRYHKYLNEEVLNTTDCNI